MADTRIILADDHAVVRAALRRLLETQPERHVVAEAATTPDAVRLAKELRPHVLLLDLGMPGGSALGAVVAVRAEAPPTQVVILTMLDDAQVARRALALGAAAYVRKEDADMVLLDAVQAAAAGGTYLSPRLGAELASAGPDAATASPALTARELEVLTLIAHGYTNGAIADRLFLSTRTVEADRARLQRKLGRTQRSELVAYALEHGLLVPERAAAKSIAP